MAARRQWQLGCGWGRVQGAICLVLPAPRPAGKWWPLLVTWLGELFIRARSPGEAEHPAAGRVGPCLHLHQRGEQSCSPLALFFPHMPLLRPEVSL